VDSAHSKSTLKEIYVDTRSYLSSQPPFSSQTDIIYVAKVFGEMSSSFRPSCRLLNQSNFFSLERAKSELQVLYQIYFSRRNLKRRKSQKPNTSKEDLATFLQLEKFVFLNYFELHVSNLDKKYTKM
jgi:hypothetical protein